VDWVSQHFSSEGCCGGCCPPDPAPNALSVAVTGTLKAGMTFKRGSDGIVAPAVDYTSVMKVIAGTLQPVAEPDRQSRDTGCGSRWTVLRFATDRLTLCQ
jgi:hypothetical protein